LIFYLPYKKRRKTKGDVAKENGLEPLAKQIMAQRPADLSSLTSRYLSDKVTTEAEALQGAVFVHPSVLGRTSWFKQHLYKEEFIGMEDYELWIRTIEKSSFAYIDDILLFYRDPLKFKLKTYLFRQKQLRNFFRNEGKKYETSYVLNKLVLISYLKSIIARLSSILNVDKLVIKKRNIHIETYEVEKKLQHILSFYKNIKS